MLHPSTVPTIAAFIEYQRGEALACDWRGSRRRSCGWEPSLRPGLAALLAVSVEPVAGATGGQANGDPGEERRGPKKAQHGCLHVIPQITRPASRHLRPLEEHGSERAHLAEAHPLVGGAGPGVETVDVEAGDRRERLGQDTTAAMYPALGPARGTAGFIQTPWTCVTSGVTAPSSALKTTSPSAPRWTREWPCADQALDPPAVVLPAAEVRRIAHFFLEHGGAGGQDPVEVRQLAKAECRVRARRRAARRWSSAAGPRGFRGRAGRAAPAPRREPGPFRRGRRSRRSGARSGARPSQRDRRARVQFDRHQVGAGPAGAEEGAAVEHAKMLAPPAVGDAVPAVSRCDRMKTLATASCRARSSRAPVSAPVEDPDGDAGGAGAVLTRR